MVNRFLLGLAIILGLSAMAPTAGAQALNAGFNDPFFLYYGFYLPRQAALAAQPTTPQILNDVSVARQQVIQQDRSGLYDPIASPLVPPPYDPLNPFQSTRPEPLPRLSGSVIGGRSSSIPAPDQAFNRTARYYPSFRAGSGGNRNMATSGRYARQNVGGGMPSYGAGGFSSGIR